MRRLTFAGYLKSYVGYLTGSDSLRLSTLWDRTSAYPRATEPLLLFAAVTGRSGLLASALPKNSPLVDDLRYLDALAQARALEEALSNEDPRLRPEYHKVWRSYVARRDANLRDADLKRTARQRIMDLEQEREVSRYRMAKDLRLNPGNLHAFLTQGNVAKLSLNHAYELLDYLDAAHHAAS